jgi:hypothetical protein
VLIQNINAAYNNFKVFTELKEISQFFKINSLGPTLWISHDWEYRSASVGHRYLFLNVVA